MRELIRTTVKHDLVEAEVMRWDHDGRQYEVPSVAHAAWQAPDGKFGIVLANWTVDAQEVTIDDIRLGDQVIVHFSARTGDSESHLIQEGQLAVRLPGSSCVLVETR